MISNQKKEPEHVKNKTADSCKNVITHLGLDMRGNVSIDSYLMMDYVLK